MASRHFSLEMTEVADVRDMLMAFEQHNSVKLELRVSVQSLNGRPDVVIAGIAHESAEAIGVAPPLASVSVRCSAMNLKHLAAALTHVMYALDFQLALNEFEATKPKKA